MSSRPAWLPGETRCQPQTKHTPGTALKKHRPWAFIPFPVRLFHMCLPACEKCLVEVQRSPEDPTVTLLLETELHP